MRSILLSSKTVAAILGSAAVMFLFIGVASAQDATEDIFVVNNLERTVVTSDFVPGEVVFRFKNDTERFRVMRVPSVAKAIEALSKNPSIEYAEPNYIATMSAVPNDPGFPAQWNFDNAVYGGVQAKAAWDITAGSPDVIVAVIDTGVRQDISDLAGTCFVPGYDFINDDSDPTDDNGHGTHVTGTIAQTTNNGLGVAGLAHGTCVMPLKVLDASGSGSYTAIANALYYAADHGAKVANMSLGGGLGNATLENALAYAYQKGVTIVAAAGNSNRSKVDYPAAYNSYVIAVGATRYDETRAYYSNYGTGLDIVAPGGDVTVDQNGDGYGDGVLQQTFDGAGVVGYYFFQGTSMATPHVAAAAALVLSRGNATTPDTVRTALESTADTIGSSRFYGQGLLNISAALAWGTPAVDQPPVADAGTYDPVVVGTPLTFDGSGSTDDHGIVSYDWTFGDGGTGTGVAPVHTYTATGTYQVILTVTDTNGAVDNDTVSVLVMDALPPAGIHLSVTGQKVKGVMTAYLNWSPSGTGNVTISRNGSVVITTGNDGNHTDVIGKGGGTFEYQVCEVGTSECSNKTQVTF